MVLVLLCAIAYSGDLIADLTWQVADSMGFKVVLTLWKSNYDAIITDSSKISVLLPTWFSVFPFPSFFISITLLYRAVSGTGRNDQGKAGHLTKTSNGSKSSRSWNGERCPSLACQGAETRSAEYMSNNVAQMQLIDLEGARKEDKIAEDLRKEGLY